MRNRDSRDLGRELGYGNKTVLKKKKKKMMMMMMMRSSEEEACGVGETLMASRISTFSREIRREVSVEREIRKCSKP